jgi:hypothetical protein
MSYMKILLTFIIACLVTCTGVASVIITDSSTYTQNFDTLAAVGTNVTWLNDNTLPGWSLFRQPAPGTAITTYTATRAFPTGSGFLSFGATGSSERALGGVGSNTSYFGGPASGTVAGWIAVSLVNQSGSRINSFSILYDGEQWLCGGNTTPQTMALEWGIGSSFAPVSSWTAPGSPFNFTSPVHSNVGYGVDGNAAGLVAGIGGTVNSVNWNNGETLWIRWIENNDVGEDHGLAVDNFRFTATVVPEPSGLCIGVCGAACLLARRRLR